MLVHLGLKMGRRMGWRHVTSPNIPSIPTPSVPCRSGHSSYMGTKEDALQWGCPCFLPLRRPQGQGSHQPGFGVMPAG